MRNLIMNATVGWLLLLATAAPAFQVIPQSVEQMTQRAKLIIHGTVLSQTSLEDAAGGIYTRIELQVDEVLKGALTNQIMVVVHGGGAVADKRVAVSGQVNYSVGQEVVAFLLLNARGEAVTLGMAQGKFEVWTEASSGDKLVRNPFHGRADSALTASSGTGELQAQSATNGGRLTLAELKRRIQGAQP